MLRRKRFMSITSHDQLWICIGKYILYFYTVGLEGSLLLRTSRYTTFTTVNCLKSTTGYVPNETDIFRGNGFKDGKVRTGCGFLTNSTFVFPDL